MIANIGDTKVVLARPITNDPKSSRNSSCPLKAIAVTREHKAIYHQSECVQVQG